MSTSRAEHGSERAIMTAGIIFLMERMVISLQNVRDMPLDPRAAAVNRVERRIK